MTNPAVPRLLVALWEGPGPCKGCGTAAPAPPAAGISQLRRRLHSRRRGTERSKGSREADAPAVWRVPESPGCRGKAEAKPGGSAEPPET